MKNKLKYIRKREGLNQKEVAELLDIHRNYYCMIETGNRSPGLQLAKNIADLFGTTIDDIFFNNTNNEALSIDNKTA